MVEIDIDNVEKEKERVLKPWVARRRWMCIHCCPVKVYTGEMVELYGNYVGIVLGTFFFFFLDSGFLLFTG